MYKRLRHTYNRGIPANEDEQVFVNGWSVIDSQMTVLNDKAWKFQLKGNQKATNKCIAAGNQLTYLFYYAYFIRQWLDRRGLIDDQCTSVAINNNFKIECIESNLPCLSANFGVDYVSVWKSLLEVFNINRQTEGCETECCIGIGEMIIEGLDTCTAYIIGSECDLQDGIIVGEFADCSFSDDFTNNEASDACLTDNCN
jgi:hypothetical protein